VDFETTGAVEIEIVRIAALDRLIAALHAQARLNVLPIFADDPGQSDVDFQDSEDIAMLRAHT
jgi:hypothetical protein